MRVSNAELVHSQRLLTGFMSKRSSQLNVLPLKTAHEGGISGDSVN